MPYSVYCLEYDEASSLIITGSRDRTIKVWSLRSGRPLGTFAGVHKGSVLCLKFEMESGSSPHESPVEYFSHSTPRQIFMVSGSSDTTVSVWDLTIFPATSGYDRAPRTLKGDVRTTLRGHAGGVLDIRLDKRWIVSWYANFFPCILIIPTSSPQLQRWNDSGVGPKHA
jgi:F-box and WD-40 domain protein 1/11